MKQIGEKNTLKSMRTSKRVKNQYSLQVAMRNAIEEQFEISDKIGLDL